MTKKPHKSKITTTFSQQLKTKSAHIDDKGVFVFTKPITIAEFAKATNLAVVQIIKIFVKKGKLYNQNYLLDETQLGETCLELGIDFRKEKDITYENVLENFAFNDATEKLEERPAVVTIMGHVDHGKTTLLDTIRNTKVTTGEHGGITQHIGAYQIKINNKIITFIDTPGHEAFTEMRARGSKVTDIVVLVVAADDGVMPQTIEAIDHAKAAGVEIIVFVNKIDKNNSNIDFTKSELSKYGLVAEDWGGTTLFVYGSALKNKNINELLEAILTIAELKELKANPNRLANGTVIESHFDKNIGPVATLLIQGGTLKLKDIVIAGAIRGKIRKMKNDQGQEVTKVGPAGVVQVFGFEAALTPGEAFFVINDEKIVKKIINAKQSQYFNKKQQITLGNIAEYASSGKLKQINIILRADTQGSVEAITQALSKIKIDNVQIRLIRATVGGISESDVKLAIVSNSMIYGFNVRPNAIVHDSAKSNEVEIRLHNIIYKIIEEIEKAAKGLLEPEYEEKIIGHAKVLKIFHFSKIGKIAGCIIIDGEVNRGSKVHIIRNDVVIYNGVVNTLKHEKNDLKVAKKGHECGITIKNYQDIKEGDIIEAYKMEVIENE